MSFHLTIPLADLSRADVSEAGGKAANSGELMAKGFFSPDGFALTTEAYRRFIESNNLAEKIEIALQSAGDDPKTASWAVTKLMIDKPIPADVSEAVKRALSVLGEDDPVAVRSSATAEDMEGASFAGLYDTALNVIGIADVLERVRSCWMSLWSERAISYRASAGVNHLEVGMAVIVQKMIDADASGVMFTVNPLTAHPREIIVDAVQGLCEDLVSGKVQPQHFVLKKSSGEIKSVIFPEADGEKEKRPAIISGKVLKKLALLATRLEREMGGPQDVEWAIEKGSIVILQSRPITTLPPADEPVYTRKMGDQYWTDVISPLTYTCGVDWIIEGAFKPMIEAMGFKEMSGMNFFRLHKSHLYMNTQMARDSITMFPKSARKQFADVMASPHDDEYILEAPFKPLSSFIGTIRTQLSDDRSGVDRNLHALAGWSRQIKYRTREMLNRIEESPDVGELMDMFEEIDRLGVEHFQIIRFGHASYNTFFTDTFRGMCEKWADDEDGSLFMSITGHLDKNVTLETDQALWETAREIGTHPKARGIILKLDPVEGAIRILGGDEFPAAKNALIDFLDNYGHRTVSRDITAAHWMDAPEQVVGVIRGLLDGGLPLSPFERADGARERMGQAMAEALKRVRKKWYGFMVKGIFKGTAEMARTFMGYRENQRFTLDRLMATTRRLALAIGARLVEQGLLDEADDIFFLERDEMAAAVKSGRLDPEIRGQIPHRRFEHASNKGQVPPTYIIGSFEFEVMEEGAEDLGPGEYAGLNASPGSAVGKARVLTELADAHMIRDGEILVTSSTDPAWSAAFMKVGGLVLETGGLLSHGAILAREFGVPAVTHVTGATKKIRTGDLIKVDGTGGRVTIIDGNDKQERQ